MGAAPQNLTLFSEFKKFLTFGPPAYTFWVKRGYQSTAIPFSRNSTLILRKLHIPLQITLCARRSISRMPSNSCSSLLGALFLPWILLLFALGYYFNFLIYFNFLSVSHPTKNILAIYPANFPSWELL